MNLSQEPVAQLLTPVKPSFWRPLSPFLLAYPLGYGLVEMARVSKLTLTRVAKNLDFSKARSFAIGSYYLKKKLLNSEMVL